MVQKHWEGNRHNQMGYVGSLHFTSITQPHRLSLSSCQLAKVSLFYFGLYLPPPQGLWGLILLVWLKHTVSLSAVKEPVVGYFGETSRTDLQAPVSFGGGGFFFRDWQVNYFITFLLV